MSETNSGGIVLVEVKEEIDIPKYGRDGWMWGEITKTGSESNTEVIDLVESEHVLPSEEATNRIETNVPQSNAGDARALLGNAKIEEVELPPVIIKDEPREKTPANTVEMLVDQLSSKQTVLQKFQASEISKTQTIKRYMRKRMKKIIFSEDRPRIINPYLLERRPGPFPQPIPYQGAIRRPLFRRARGSEPPCDRS